ncbi:reverse transcriptase domain-containing protein [Tanacetum coccineum]
MVPATAPLIGFSGEIIWPIGRILLPIKIGDAEHFTSTWMNFVVVKSPSLYNGIIRRPEVRKIQADNPLECTMVSGPEAPPFDVIRVAKERIKVAIGFTLTEEGWKALCELLRRNLDIFAWKPEDMTGVLRYLAEHRLNIREGCLPVRQKKRSQAPKRNKAIQEEVAKLVDAEIMKEVHYHSWLSNSVMVKKNDDSWRMCVDFKDLNKAYLKDGHPLPEIDWKNAGATYQRLVDKAFQKQIGRNLEVYVDELVIKSRMEHEIIRDIEEAFKTLREINMKLNPKKCAFGIEKGMILGYKYRPRTSVKGQILSDFIVERLEDESLAMTTKVKEEIQDPWTLFINRSSSVDGFGARLIVNGSYISNESSMVQYLEKVKALASSFKKFSIKQVPISENKKADALRKITSTSFAHLTKQVLVEELKEKSIHEAEVLTVVEEEGSTWMTPIYEYLTEEALPAEKEKARAIRRNMHAGTRSVVAKALQIGYYWPTMYADARKMIRECQDCHVHRLVPRNPQQKLTPIMSPWPFYKWGIDIAGPFPKGLGKVKFLIVVIDYFTKDNPFKDWCEKLCIRQHFTSVKHSQANGLVERANRSLGEGIKSSNEDTPFSLTYRTEAVIPAEIGMPILRIAEIDMVQNDEALEINLDLLEEKKEQEAIREARSKEKMEKYYNSKFHNTSFKPGDLVHRNNDASHAKDSGKLSPKWEGPYEVTESLGNEAYKLMIHNRKLLP